MATITVDHLEIPTNVQSLDGFREWVAGLGEGGPRLHFFRGGVFVQMSPQDYLTHVHLVDAINRKLASLSDASNLGRYYMPPSWVTVPEAELSTEPDGFLVAWGSFQSGRVQVNPERTVELLGPPTMALEVVSPSSEKKDLVELVDGYAAAGVSEYWIADGRQAPASLRILDLQADGGYEDQTTDEEGWLFSPLFERAFRIQSFTNPADLPDYRLEVQE